MYSSRAVALLLSFAVIGSAIIHAGGALPLSQDVNLDNGFPDEVEVVEPIKIEGKSVEDGSDLLKPVGELDLSAPVCPKCGVAHSPEEPCTSVECKKCGVTHPKGQCTMGDQDNYVKEKIDEADPS